MCAIPFSETVSMKFRNPSRILRRKSRAAAIGSSLATPLLLLPFLWAPVRVYGQIPGHDTVTAPTVTLRRCVSDSAPSGPGLQCFENENGWFLTPDSVWAARAAALLQPAVARFEALFGKSTGRGINMPMPLALPGNDTTKVGPVSMGKVREQWTWYWFTPKDWAAPSPSVEFRINPHELGHAWLMNSYAWQWESGYGTPAADWLDEAAAVLMEDTVLTKLRRDELIKYYRKRQATQKGMLPLDTLLTMAHPSEGTAPPVTLDALSRGFADFLLERATDPTILDAIAANEASGSNIADWLKANGARHGLPTTISDLDKEWQRWVARLAAAAPGR
jgi:hypothetical protein